MGGFDATVVQLLTALVLGAFGAGVGAWIKLRRDVRDGRKADLDLFNEMRAVSLSSVRDLRAEVEELRGRVDLAEARAEAAEKNAQEVRAALGVAMMHLGYLEDVMRSAGLSVPPRPAWIRDTDHP